MTAFRALSRVLLLCDLRDVSTLVFTFAIPPALLVAFTMAFGDRGSSVNQVGADVITFGTAFVGLYAGATHLAAWRENGMIRVLRATPMTRGAILCAQAAVGVGFAVAQAALLVGIGSLPWLGMTPAATAPLAMLGIVLGYLTFFFAGALLASWAPSVAAVSMLANIVIVPLGIVGGTMVPLELLPSWVRALGVWTPFFHLRELISFPLIHAGGWMPAVLGAAYLAVLTGALYAVVRSAARWS